MAGLLFSTRCRQHHCFMSMGQRVYNDAFPWSLRVLIIETIAHPERSKSCSTDGGYIVGNHFLHVYQSMQAFIPLTLVSQTCIFVEKFHNTGSEYTFLTLPMLSRLKCLYFFSTTFIYSNTIFNSCLKICEYIYIVWKKKYIKPCNHRRLFRVIQRYFVAQ